MIKKTNKNINTFMSMYTILSQNSTVRFSRSQTPINQNLNLFITIKKKQIEFFNLIDFKNTLYKVFIFVKHFCLISRKNDNKFLFTTTNPAFSEIISVAATNAAMLSHSNRWTCGLISRKANLSIQKEIKKNIITTKKKIVFISFSFFMNLKKIKKNNSVINNLVGVFIPDVQNNSMIIKEAQIVNIPTIGIINSNSKSIIEYPIFGNDKSLFSVFFFSNILAYWIKLYNQIYNLKLKKNNFFKQKNKNTKIFNSIKKKIYFRYFLKQYLYMIYYFSKRFKTNTLSEDVLYDFPVNQNIKNYKKKWFKQKNIRSYQNNLFFWYEPFSKTEVRLTKISQLLKSNFSGGLSFVNRLWGNYFWMQINPIFFTVFAKKKHRNWLNPTFKWFKNLRWQTPKSRYKRRYNKKISKNITTNYNKYQKKKQWKKIIR